MHRPAATTSSRRAWPCSVTSQQLDLRRRRGALERLLAWKLSLHGRPAAGRVTVEVDPAGARYSRFPAGAHVSLPHIAGHRDGDSTECPGNVLYGELPAIRRASTASRAVPHWRPRAERDRGSAGRPAQRTGGSSRARRPVSTRWRRALRARSRPGRSGCARAHGQPRVSRRDSDRRRADLIQARSVTKNGEVVPSRRSLGR